MSEPITLVLGGMGVKGVASIGILQSLDEHGIKIKKIVAAGISSLVAGQYALGKDMGVLPNAFTRFFAENSRSLWGLEQLSDFLQSPQRRVLDSFAYFLRERLYCNANLKQVSALSWKLIEPQIAGFFGTHSFSDLRVPLAVSAIDLKKGKEVLLKEGKLTDSMKASIAFPGLFPPISMNNSELVSSTLYCELPLESIGKKDAPVMAIDIPSIFSNRKLRSMLEIVSLTDDIRNKAIKQNLLVKTDYLLSLESLKRFRWGNYRQILQMVAQARNETDKLLESVVLPRIKQMS
ncbi:MAG: patatin-like phospholipase family protein [Dehalococcoidales bacterium]|nr:patatin-like phospholipase family protein [Dehalococcoidales bacterium]